MRTYIGGRLPGGAAVVMVQHGDYRDPLVARRDLVDHSPTGFEWGYSGSGPAQLALAILADVLAGLERGDERAVELHQDFKSDVIACLSRESWRIEESFVRRWIERGLVRSAASARLVGPSVDELHEVVRTVLSVTEADPPLFAFIEALWRFRRAHPEHGDAGLIELTRAMLGEISHREASPDLSALPSEELRAMREEELYDDAKALGWERD